MTRASGQVFFHMTRASGHSLPYHIFQFMKLI